MLSGKLPGFLPHHELLLRIRVTPVPINPASGAPDSTGLPPALGPLGAQPRLLSGPAMRWGHEAADTRLWGTHGFDSRRLPTTSGKAAASLLEQLRLQRFAAAPLVEGAVCQLQKPPGQAFRAAWIGAQELPGTARALEQTAFLTAAGLLTLACIVVPLGPVREAYWALWDLSYISCGLHAPTMAAFPAAQVCSARARIP